MHPCFNGGLEDADALIADLRKVLKNYELQVGLVSGPFLPAF